MGSGFHDGLRGVHVDSLVTKAYLSFLQIARIWMAKNAWDKKAKSGSTSVFRSAISGRFLGVRSSKSAAGSALSQTERVKAAFKATNKDTQTFKPKNAR